MLVERWAPASVDGIDPSEGQLAFARTRPASRLAQFRQADAMALPFPDDSFDAAVMPLVHLPVQSGSDRILEAMNRKHTAADYHRTIDRFRKAREDIAFTSDFIVGFPSETEEDFDELVEYLDSHNA